MQIYRYIPAVIKTMYNVHNEPWSVMWDALIFKNMSILGCFFMLPVLVVNKFVWFLICQNMKFLFKKRNSKNACNDWFVWYWFTCLHLFMQLHMHHMKNYSSKENDLKQNKKNCAGKKQNKKCISISKIWSWLNNKVSVN